jgi:GPI ethanolamine phosphate transferase 1
MEWIQLLINLSLLGGILMVAVGLTYLAFENRILADFSSASTPKAQRTENALSRALIGAQV